MSIVERALKKAQSSLRGATAPKAEANADDPRVETRPASADADADVYAALRPSAASRPDRDASGDTSLTSRDLKAIVHFDVEALRAAGRLPSIGMAEQAEEEIRRVKWPLLRAIASGVEPQGGKPVRNNVILVTSALAGEGKTFTSLNLALSIVRDREMRVVLVDGDVARPGLTPTLGLEGRPGLVDVLEDKALDVNTVTYQTDVEGLFFVPAGKWHPHSPEFIAGSRMPEVIEALSRRVGHGVIIIDSPPLLATNEAQVATRYAGQVLLVVQADSTEQQAVVDAIALVEKSTPVSAVLNRVQQSVLSRYYGHYYYRYGKAYKSDHSRRAHPQEDGV